MTTGLEIAHTKIVTEGVRMFDVPEKIKGNMPKEIAHFEDHAIQMFPMINKLMNDLPPEESEGRKILGKLADALSRFVKDAPGFKQGTHGDKDAFDRYIKDLAKAFSTYQGEMLNGKNVHIPADGVLKAAVNQY